MQKIQEKAEHEAQMEEEEKRQPDQISPHRQQYKKFFAKQLYPRDISQITHMLNQHKISYSPNVFSFEVSIIKRCQTKFQEVVTLSVSFSNFNFIINILNLPADPFSMDLEIIGKGAQGAVHQVYYDAKKFPHSFDQKKFPSDGKLAIKKTAYNGSKSLKMIIIEYCYSKLSSALKIGPLIYDLFGFDLIVSKRYAEFGMEICSRKQVSDESSLKDQLCLLHFFHIIHGDIKPQNIMWSQSYKKFVFIDYGFTNSLGTKQGHLSKTTFIGTLNYCCEQMKNLFSSNQENYVDMYFNDLYGLRESLKQLREQVKQISPKEENSKSKQINKKIFNIILQKLIFLKDLKRIKQFLGNHQGEYISGEAILLLSSVFPGKKFQMFNREEDSQTLNQQKKKVLDQRQIYHKRIKEEFTKIGCESYYVQMNKFFTFQDISQKAKQFKNNLYKKIKSNHYLPQNKYFWKMFLNYFSNLFTSQKQAFQIFDQVRKMAGVNQMQKNWSVAMEAWQIIQMVSEKYGYDLLLINYQLQVENCYNLQKQMIESNFYSKQPYATINAFSFSADLVNECSSQFYEAYQKQMENMAHRVKEEVEKNYDHQDEIITDVFLFFLSNYFNISSNVQANYQRAISRINGDDFGKKSKLFFEIMKRKNFANVINSVTTWYQLQDKIRNDNKFYNYSFDYEYLLQVYFYSQIFSKTYFNEQIQSLGQAEKTVRSLIKWTQKYLKYRKKMPCFRNFFQYLIFLYNYCHDYIKFRGYLLIIEAIHQILILFYSKFKFVDKFQIFHIFPIREQHIRSNSREAKYNEFYEDLMNNKLNYQFTLNQQISLYRRYLGNKVIRQVSSAELIRDLQKYETNVLQNNPYSKLFLIYKITSYIFMKNQFNSEIEKLKKYISYIEEWYEWYVEHGQKLNITDLNTQLICACALSNLYIFCEDSGEKALNFILTNKFKSIGLKETKTIIQNLFEIIDYYFHFNKRKSNQNQILSNKYEMIHYILQVAKANQKDRILQRKINQIGFIIEMLAVHIIHQLDLEYLKSRLKELIAYENSILIFCSYIRKYCSHIIWSNLDKLLTILNRKMLDSKIISTPILARKLAKSRLHQFRKIKSIQSQTFSYILRNEIQFKNPVQINKLTDFNGKNIWQKTKIKKIQRKIKNYQINKQKPYEFFQQFCPQDKKGYQRENYYGPKQQKL